jgi:Zn-dependent M16 (insulinase) family peptidase
MTIVDGFEVLREQHITELNTTARIYRHVKTGAELLSLINQDENKVFGITFRTPPHDATGVAHILEHSVLCGSRKYPVKEPFVELLKGSLKTFLNAMTYPDKTCYPVASQNVQDFYNLVDVYLDAVFFPRLTPFTLQQEGWHFELDDPDSPLTYKGVVYNEMKGSYSSPDRILMEYSQQSLFPGHAYGFDAGGDPKEIPKLTFEQFLAFHQKYYHPSNARITFYGDDDPAQRLRLVNEYLQQFEPLEVRSSIGLQPSFDQPRHIIAAYAAGEAAPSNAQGMVTINWLLTETTDTVTNLALNILQYILLGMPASPLRKALIESGLGEDMAGAGLEGELRQMYFSTGLKGIDPANADRVAALILETLEKLVREGIDPRTVEAALNTTEFRLRENNSGSYPRGLLLMLRALSTWLYDGDPLALLAFEIPLAAVKAQLAANPRYFEELLDRQLLQNLHRTTLVLGPDSELAQREENELHQHLAEVRAALSAEELQAIIDNARELKRRQEAPDAPEALATIPSLRVADLEKKNKPIPTARQDYITTPILFHDLFTNGIVYLDLALDLHILEQHYLPYVPLFGRALVEMGTEQEDYVTLTQRISRKTGGIRPKFFTSIIKDTQDGMARLFLRGKAMLPQADELLNILRDVLLTVRLDNRERFRQMVLEEKARHEQALVPAGHQFVNLRLRAHFNEADWAAEQMNGVNYLFFLRGLARAVDEDWPMVLRTLEDMRRILANRQALVVNVTVDDAGWSQLAPRVHAFLDTLPVAPVTRSPWNRESGANFEAMIIPSQVNYVGKGADLFALGYKLHGSAQVICRYLRTSFLWDRVRVQGGAYGAFCNFNGLSGALTLVSYRDPNLVNTLEVFDQTAHFLANVELSKEELNKSIIGAIGDVDSYQLPDAKGFAALIRYFTGNNDVARQHMREEILATTADDFKAFAAVLAAVRDTGLVKVLGSESAISQANAERNGWLEVLKVL